MQDGQLAAPVVIEREPALSQIRMMCVALRRMRATCFSAVTEAGAALGLGAVVTVVTVAQAEDKVAAAAPGGGAAPAAVVRAEVESQTCSMCNRSTTCRTRCSSQRRDDTPSRASPNSRMRGISAWAIDEAKSSNDR